jgi:hypothetical protein
MDITNKVPDFNTLAKAGWKGTQRSLTYIKNHGKTHPYVLLFGPLGGLLIPENEVNPGKKPAKIDLVPTSFIEGPPLPSSLNIKWPWKGTMK